MVLLGNLAPSIEGAVKSFYSCLLCMLAHSCLAQIKWATWLPGDSSFGLYVGADKRGHSYVAGQFYGTVTLSNHVLTSTGDSDIFILKLREDGTVAWAKTIGGPGADFPTAIAVKPGGELFVAGRVDAAAQFLNGEVSASSGAFVLKLNHSGHLQWVRQLEQIDATVKFLSSEHSRTELWMSGFDKGTVFTAAWDRKGEEKFRSAITLPAEPSFTALTLDRSHNVFLTGSLLGSGVFGDVMVEGERVEPRPRHFVAKLNANGRWEWAQRWMRYFGAFPAAIVAAPDGSIATTGDVIINHRYLFTTRHSASGGLLQAETRGEYRGSYAGNAIAVDRSGRRYVAGRAVGYGLDPNRRFSAFVLGPGFEYRIESRTLADFNHARGICVDDKNRVYVTGDFAGEATFGAQVLGKGTSGGPHAFIMRIDDAVRKRD
jgi:hypothetical protein